MDLPRWRAGLRPTEQILTSTASMPYDAIASSSSPWSHCLPYPHASWCQHDQDWYTVKGGFPPYLPEVSKGLEPQPLTHVLHARPLIGREHRPAGHSLNLRKTLLHRPAGGPQSAIG
jgi:hypothetical protein